MTCLTLHESTGFGALIVLQIYKRILYSTVCTNIQIQALRSAASACYLNQICGSLLPFGGAITSRTTGMVRQRLAYEALY